MTTRHPRAGRTRIQVVVSRDELATLDSCSQLLGVDRSAYLRLLGLERAGYPQDWDAARAAHARRRPA